MHKILFTTRSEDDASDEAAACRRGKELGWFLGGV
jgi:hypothetical protein